MKKIITYLGIFATLLFLGSANVYADGYWEEYFKDRALSRTYGAAKWENMQMEYSIEHEEGGMGSWDPHEPFYNTPYNQNILFENVSNVSAVSSNTNILDVEVKPYDYAKEKQNWEKYVEDFNKATFEEFLKNYEYCQDENGNFSKDSEYCKSTYTSKPTWWEYTNEYGFSNYKSEPKTWWEAYGYSSEPTGVEVVTKAKDLGKSSITVSATGKQDIKIDWTISARDFGEMGSSAAGLTQILNHLDKYQEVMPDSPHDCIYGYGKYNFSVRSSKEDISEVINALKGKDLTVLFIQDTSVGTSTYYLNGKDIKNTVEQGFTYEHQISMKTSINKDKIANLMELNDALYIDFTYHGNLPTNYELNVNIEQYIRNLYWEKLDEKYQCSQYDYKKEPDKYNACWTAQEKEVNEKVKDYLQNKTLTLLYLNPETNQMEVVAENLKATDGNVKLTFTHFSTYVLVPSDGYHKKNNNAQTGTLNVVLYSGLAVVSLLGIGYLIISKKKEQ